MSDKKQEILQILFDNDKSQSWLQDQLKRKGIDQNIYELLKASRKTIDVNIYEAIIDIFRDNNFITNETERCNLLERSIFHLDSIIGGAFQQLNALTEGVIADNQLTHQEKGRVLDELDRFERKIIIEIDKARAKIK